MVKSLVIKSKLVVKVNRNSKEKPTTCIQVVQFVSDLSMSNHLPRVLILKVIMIRKNISLQFKSCNNLVIDTRFVHNLKTYNTFSRIKMGPNLMLPF